MNIKGVYSGNISSTTNVNEVAFTINFEFEGLKYLALALIS